MHCTTYFNREYKLNVLYPYLVTNFFNLVQYLFSEYFKLSGQDLTAQYLDFEIRLENAEKARARYLELLEKAENVESALLVEKELERLNGTIDMLIGQMNRMNHLTTYATITVRISERVKPGPLGYLGMGLYHAFKWLFVRN
ncbi:MAG: DUF4349 domain-containing protein [Bacteroidetes bacterium]|nr:DUF4349 domain-containing protein [Bacteroidota bacterium]